MAWALPVFVISEFLRVVTHPRVLVPPSQPSDALTAIRSLLESPTSAYPPGERYWPLLRETILESGVAGQPGAWDAGTELVRRRVPLEELDADGDMVAAEVLATLTAARRLTAGDGHVEVAHEALLREWPRLQGWLADDAAGRQVRLHLIGAARDWQPRP